MRTIGTRAGEAHRGDFVATCAYCGAAWYRSALKRNAAGQLICPDDQHIRDPVTLSRLNSRALSRLRRPRQDGGLADIKPAPSVSAIVGEANVVAGWSTSSSVTLTDGGRVSSWAAESGGLTLSVGLPPKLKPDGPNGRSYVSFEGAHALAESTGAFARPAPSVEPTFFWAVLRPPRFAMTSFLWGFAAAGASFALALITSPFSASPDVLFTLNPNPAASLTAPTRFRRVEAAFTASTSDYFKLGALTSSGDAGANVPTGQFVVGARADPFVGNSFLNHSYLDLCELWILRALPTAAQREQLDDYARAKYGSEVVL